MSKSREVLELSGFKSRITELVEKINASPEILIAIKDWINGYNGKTIGFKMPDETFYITFGKKEARMFDGEPASFDLMLLSDEETLISGIFNNPTSMRQYLKDGTVLIWGNLHEILKFTEIIILSQH